MLNLWGSRQGINCDGSTRRDFLRVGALGVGGLLLPDLLRVRAATKAAGQPTRNTSVIWLWLGGGPTQVETFDPKMSAPAEYRSTVAGDWRSRHGPYNRGDPSVDIRTVRRRSTWALRAQGN